MFDRLFALRAAVALTFVLLATDCRSQCAPPPGGMTSWWTLDIGGNDLLGNNQGTVLGTPVFGPGMVGDAVTLNSNDDAITIPHDPSLDVGPTGFAVEFWMRGVKNQPDPQYLVVDKSHGWVDSTGWLFQGNSSSGELAFAIGAGGPGSVNFPAISSGVDVLDGVFHHVCGIWNGTQIELFVDGIWRAATPLSTPANNTRVVNIGFSFGAPSSRRAFRGEVDELSIYPRPLSAAEIAAIANAGSAGKCRQPAASVFRNGSGINPTGFTSITDPVIGTNWVSAVATGPATQWTLLATAAQVAQTPMLGGELLVDGSSVLAVLWGAGTHTLPIPNHLGFVGVQFATQGARVELSGGQLSIVLMNALDIMVGL